MNIKWNKIDSQRHISTNKHYAIVGRYTYYQGWTPYFLPDGIKGEWIALDGMYKGKGALAFCRQLCDKHANKTITV